VPGLGVPNAQQYFELVPFDTVHFGRSVDELRIKTHSSSYSLRLDNGGHEICWHWHPVDNSDESQTHMYYSGSGRAHLLCPRQTFEDGVESCIDMLRKSGDSNTNEYWQKRLDISSKTRESCTPKIGRGSTGLGHVQRLRKSSMRRSSVLGERSAAS